MTVRISNIECEHETGFSQVFYFIFIFIFIYLFISIWFIVLVLFIYLFIYLFFFFWGGGVNVKQLNIHANSCIRYRLIQSTCLILDISSIRHGDSTLPHILCSGFLFFHDKHNVYHDVLLRGQRVRISHYGREEITDISQGNILNVFVLCIKIVIFFIFRWRSHQVETETRFTCMSTVCGIWMTVIQFHVA